MCGLMCIKGKFSPVQWKTAEKKMCFCKIHRSFSLDNGAGQLCHLKELYRHDLAKLISLTLLTDSQTTIVRPIIDKMNQHLLDNFKKCVDLDGVVVYKEWSQFG